MTREAATKVSLGGKRMPDFPRELLASGAEKHYAPGAVIFTAGSEAEGLYLVLEGHVRVVRGSGGRVHVIHEETAGGTLGEVPLFEGGRFPATAIASVRTRCLLLTRAAVEAAVRRDPDIGLALLARLASRVRVLVDQLDSRTGQATLERLAAHLIERADASMHVTSAQPTEKLFTLGGTQHEIAESLGTVREVVVRGLRTLRDDGVIRSDGRGRYTVVDRAMLERIARRSDQ